MKKNIYFLISIGLLLAACGNKVKKVFYKNGGIKTESVYNRNGLKDGIEREYYENGVLKIICCYKNDTLEGFYKDFHINGATASITIFKKGLQHGPIMTYSENGILLQYHNYFFGKKNGLSYLFYNNGNLRSVSFAKHNATQYKIVYDSLGNIEDKQHLINLDILNKPTINDSIKIKAKVIGFYDGGKTGVFTFIQKHLEDKEGNMPKMRFNSSDSCFYYSFPPTKDSGKYNILIHFFIDNKFRQMTDTVFVIN